LETWNIDGVKKVSTESKVIEKLNRIFK